MDNVEIRSIIREEVRQALFDNSEAGRYVQFMSDILDGKVSPIDLIEIPAKYKKRGLWGILNGVERELISESYEAEVYEYIGLPLLYVKYDEATDERTFVQVEE